VKYAVEYGEYQTVRADAKALATTAKAISPSVPVVIEK